MWVDDLLACSRAYADAILVAASTGNTQSIETRALRLARVRPPGGPTRLPVHAVDRFGSPAPSTSWTRSPSWRRSPLS